MKEINDNKIKDKYLYALEKRVKNDGGFFFFFNLQFCVVIRFKSQHSTKESNCYIENN